MIGKYECVLEKYLCPTNEMEIGLIILAEMMIGGQFVKRSSIIYIIGSTFQKSNI